MADQQAGWYPDPSGDASKLRYWNGTQWTNDFADAQGAAQPGAQPTQPVQPVQPEAQPTMPTGQVPPAPPSQPQTQAQPQIPVQPQGFAPSPGPQPGQAQPPMYAPVSGGQPKKSRTGLIIGIVVGAVVVVAIIVAVVIFASGSCSSDTSASTNTSSNLGTNNSSSNNSNNSSNNNGSTSTDGDVIGTVGEKLETRWFTFTVDSVSVAQSYDSHTAASGNSLAIVHISLTNTTTKSQPFGTFDWLLGDDSIAQSQYIKPLSPLNENMMPSSFDLDSNSSASYDIVFEFSSDLSDPFITYVELDNSGNAYKTFKVFIR